MQFTEDISKDSNLRQGSDDSDIEIADSGRNVFN